MNNIPIIPIQLQNLFDDMTFIGNVPPNHKLCVKSKCYSNSSSWIHWSFRKLDFESSSLTVNFIHNTCTAASQAYSSFSKTQFENVILSKLILLRNGIKNIQKTYINDVKTSNSLETSLLIIDLILPQKIKSQLGLISNNYNNFINDEYVIEYEKFINQENNNKKVSKPIEIVNKKENELKEISSSLTSNLSGISDISAVTALASSPPNKSKK